MPPKFWSHCCILLLPPNFLLVQHLVLVNMTGLAEAMIKKLEIHGRKCPSFSILNRTNLKQNAYYQLLCNCTSLNYIYISFYNLTPAVVVLGSTYIFNCFVVTLLIHNAIVRVGPKLLSVSHVHGEKFQSLIKQKLTSFTYSGIPNTFLSN